MKEKVFIIIKIQITCEQVSSKNKFGKCARAGCYIFLGHFYTCGNFGHKAINCRINERNNYGSYMNGENSRYENVCRPFNRNYNPFDPLMDQNIVCYKCNNLGHKARDCREMKEDNHMPNVCIPTTTWKRKEIPHNENCRIALVAKECKEKDEWFIDSGCSSHMTGDQSKFVSLNVVNLLITPTNLL
jgi:hypothetical protein